MDKRFADFEEKMELKFEKVDIKLFKNWVRY